MLSLFKPKNGSLIVSEPFMADPNFKRSVVLLTEYEDAGALGFILNQRGDFLLDDLMPELKGSDFPVHIGGPVAMDTLHFVHSCYDKINSGLQIRNGVYWGGNFETVKVLLSTNQLNRNEIKFFVGYSGWASGQLNEEINQNAWLVTDQYSPEVIFVENEENLWREVVIGLGPRYAHIVNFPENPQWN